MPRSEPSVLLPLIYHSFHETHKQPWMTKKWWSSYRAIKSQHRETQSCHPYKTPLLASSTTKTVRVWTYCENVGHVKTLPIPSTHRQLSHPVQTSSFRGILNLQCRETRFLWPQHVLLASSSSGLNLRLFSFLCSSNSMSSFMDGIVVVLKWCRNEPPFLLTVVVEVLQ